MATAKVSQLLLPIQATPVNRWALLEPTMIDYGPTPQIHIWVVPEGDPQPGNHAYFSSQTNQRLGICPTLSSYAVARCVQRGGLF